MAVENNNKSKVLRLIAQGADVNARASTGDTALSMARRRSYRGKRYIEIENLLRKSGAWY